MEDVYRSTSYKGSLEQVAWDEEGQGANPKEFQEIAKGLAAGGTPEGEAPASVGVHEASAAPYH